MGQSMYLTSSLFVIPKKISINNAKFLEFENIIDSILCDYSGSTFNLIFDRLCRQGLS